MVQSQAQVLPIAVEPGPPPRQRQKARRLKKRVAAPPPVKARPAPEPKPYKPPPREEPRKPYTLPTLEDCQTRDVHYFKTDLKGHKPDCGHQASFKQCNNCGKVVWVYCSRCEQEKSAQRSTANFGAAVAKVKFRGPDFAFDTRPGPGVGKKNQNQK